MSNKDDISEEVEEKEYEVETILDRKVNTEDCYYYHIKWVGYSQTTWEPLSNLLGGQAVQKMVSDFEKSLERKNKKNWSNGLASWANLSKNTSKNNQNINKDNLDLTFYSTTEKKDQEIIDLEKVFDESVGKPKKNDDNPFVGSLVKKKFTIFSNQRYPFEKTKQISKRPFFMKKVSEIKKIQLLQGVSKCLVKWKAPQNNEQWVPTDIIRLTAPEILVDAYYKESLQGQTKKLR